jgi:2-polyprenyl-6-hydroxyphenyl methylase/3-demethylubiquinone-9 3-methyltransferase
VVPAGIHDPALFVAPARLVGLFAGHGIDLRLSGLRPSVPQGLAWLAGRRRDVTMRGTRFTGVVYQGIGTRVAA